MLQGFPFSQQFVLSVWAMAGRGEQRLPAAQRWGWGLFAHPGAVSIQIRGANGNRATQTPGGWTASFGNPAARPPGPPG